MYSIFVRILSPKMAIRCVLKRIYDDLFQYYTEPQKTTVPVKPDWGKLRLIGDEIFATTDF
jgi:hypothetical protein